MDMETRLAQVAIGTAEDLTFKDLAVVLPQAFSKLDELAPGAQIVKLTIRRAEKNETALPADPPVIWIFAADLNLS